MTAQRQITIVGGGLAGLTLGIGLRQQHIPVVIIEAGQYPRHRVCGEFISGRGQQSLKRLGLADWLARNGAVPASTAAFFSASRATAPRALPEPALCISRFALDHALAQKFLELGGELMTGERWRENGFGEGVVRASGRRLPSDNTGARWFGLKIHARDVSLDADLEMHFASSGYVGLCRLGGGEVNVCGLFRRNQDRSLPGDARDLLRGQPGSWLRQRLAGAPFDEASFCATAGLSLRPGRAEEHTEICVGDAITMIPPLTGNGMSMAFESAGLALEPLAAWSRGEIQWSAARRQIARECDERFARRLTWAARLHPFLLTAAWQNLLLPLVSRNQWLWQTAFGSTR